VLPLLPLRDIAVFPYQVIPFFVGRDKSVAALNQAMAGDREILLAAQRNARVSSPSPEDIYTVGTVGQLIQALRLPDGTMKVLMEGKRRAIITRYTDETRFLEVEVTFPEEPKEHTVEVEALVRSVIATFESYVKLSKRVPPEILLSIQSIEDPGRLADQVAAQLPLKLPDRQALLEAFSPSKRLEKLFEIMQAEIEIMQVEKRIRTRVKKQMEKTQKEYYLNEQMQAIQKELGEHDEFRSELAEIEEKLKHKRLSKEAEARVRREIRKLRMMAPLSPEATVLRNYIDWVVSLPWNEFTETRLNIAEAERVLDEDHYGLRTVKERILEYLAVHALVEKLRGPILCLVGPPGVGKTSLGKSVARATGRRFVRLSLGGVRDEAEIRGHRRTYIGALPGKIIQAMRRAGASNPVFLLDEVDKMSSDFRGDPAAALLEVLDPEQNATFQDHYLDLDYDLSNVLFITTANSLHGIPLPLQDRMEIIQLPGYTEWEKLAIAKQFLIPKQKEANGIARVRCDFSDEAVRMIITQYTQEAGVRNLEREIATVCRKVARDVVHRAAKSGKEALPIPGSAEGVRDEYAHEAGKAHGRAHNGADSRKRTGSAEPADAPPHVGHGTFAEPEETPRRTKKRTDEALRTLRAEQSNRIIACAPHYRITPRNLEKYLGVPRFHQDKVEEHDQVGLALGLAVTSHGGDLLPTEVAVMPGKGKLHLTGKLGEVMQESAQAAMSYVRSRAEALGLEPDFYARIDVHVHCPEGAIPKDGPSAGITMATALVSALVRVPVRRDVAMTGEITLRGRVLPVGGIKEKILAAHRSRVFVCLVPKENERDLKEVPERVLREMRIVPVTEMDEVLRAALALENPETLFRARSDVVAKAPPAPASQQAGTSPEASAARESAPVHEPQAMQAGGPAYDRQAMQAGGPAYDRQTIQAGGPAYPIQAAGGSKGDAVSAMHAEAEHDAQGSRCGRT